MHPHDVGRLESLREKISDLLFVVPFTNVDAGAWVVLGMDVYRQLFEGVPFFQGFLFGGRTERSRSRKKLDEEENWHVFCFTHRLIIPLVEYIDISSQVEHGVLEKIAQIEQSGKPIIIWGVGTHTQRLLATSRLGKAKIRVFVDSNKRYYDKMMNGIPIIAPELLFDMDEPILISSRLYQEEIADQIRQKFNLPNEIIRLY